MKEYMQFITLLFRLTVCLNLFQVPLTYASTPSNNMNDFDIAMISTHEPYQRMKSDEFKLIGSEGYTRTIALWIERIVEAFSDVVPFPGDLRLYLFTPFSVFSPRQLHSLVFIVCVRFDFLLDSYLGEIHHILEEVFEGIGLDIQLYGFDQTTFVDLFSDRGQSMTPMI